ncbi:unnamed protein product [Prorocentrum cordatum]|uniref:Uncharacterized protein n=1 Tax=Prorocentrum cordatum TaxID=2364126 RepID=A0ABN9WUK8_9DINO|nr:unnamed protein product [Polarella glacialis]
MLVAAAGRRRQRRNRRLMNDLRKEPAAFVEVSSASSSAEDSSAPSPTRAPRQEFAGTAGATSSRSAQRPAKANKMGPAHKFGEPNGKRPWTTTEWLDTPVGAQKQDRRSRSSRGPCCPTSASGTSSSWRTPGRSRARTAAAAAPAGRPPQAGRS